MSKEENIKLKHELKGLIDGGIRNIGRFDEILNILEKNYKKEQLIKDIETLQNM